MKSQDSSQRLITLFKKMPSLENDTQLQRHRTAACMCLDWQAGDLLHPFGFLFINSSTKKNKKIKETQISVTVYKLIKI